MRPEWEMATGAVPEPIHRGIDDRVPRAISHLLEGLMLRLVPLVALLAASLFALSCQDTVVRTGQITVQVNPLYENDFDSFETFSVVTADLVDPPEDVPEIGDRQQAFNEQVNELIIEAMTNEPVCMEFIAPEQVTAENQPDLWAANGLAQETNGGYVYECCGGWWWGWWGWYWNPCATLCPTWVEYDIGSLLVPVGFPVASGDDPQYVFAGLAQALVDPNTTVETIEFAIQEIFRQWPVQRSCSPQ